MLLRFGYDSTVTANARLMVACSLIIVAWRKARTLFRMCDPRLIDDCVIGYRAKTQEI